jgi:hypothetical protein
MKKQAAVLLLLAFWLLPATARAQNDRVRVGKDIVIKEDETAQDVVCIGCNIHVLGAVAQDAVAVGGNIDVEGAVGQDVVTVGGTLRLRSSAAVGQDAVAVGGKVEREEGASVGGEVVSGLTLPVAGLAGFFLFLILLSTVTHLILVLVTFLIAGQARIETLAGTVSARPGLSLLTGLGLLVGFVVLCIVAAFMGPVAPLVYVVAALAMVVTLLVGYTGLSFWMGRLLNKTWAPVLAVLVGALVITLLQLVPLVFPVFALLALGTAVLSGYGSETEWLSRQVAGQPAVPPAPPGGGGSSLSS